MLRFKLGRLTKNNLQSARFAHVAKKFSRLLDIQNAQVLPDFGQEGVKERSSAHAVNFRFIMRDYLFSPKAIAKISSLVPTLFAMAQAISLESFLF